MRQVFVYKKVLSSILRVVLFATIIFFSSCNDENAGEYKLTGDISSFIPDDAYNLSVTRSDVYISYAPYLSENFEVWGLKIRKVDYYVDGKMYSSTESKPFDILLKKSDFENGQHSLKAKMHIVGDYCDETILEVSDDFYGETTDDSNYFDCYIDYNKVENGELLVVEPLLNAERSSPGTKIDKVDYYWDGQLAETATKAPFTWKSQKVYEDGESHNWRVVIHYSNAMKKDLRYDFIYSNYSTLKDNSEFTFYNIMSRRNDYKLGETVSSIVKSYQGKNSHKQISIKLLNSATL